MDKIIVVVFDDEKKAYEGSKAFVELQNEGSISLYAITVIARDLNGKMVMKQNGDQGPIGTAVGMVTGSLIGMIGGPVGLALGAGVGAFGGMVSDLSYLGVAENFLSEVEESLQPGKAAVVAEIWEDWTLPVDTRMEPLGGIVIRHTRGEVVDTQIKRDVAELKDDLAELEAERDQATGEAKEKLQLKVDAARTKLEEMQDRILARIEASKQEAEAKRIRLQEQAARARSEQKVKLEGRIAEMQAGQKRRSGLLEQAKELIKEALTA